MVQITAKTTGLWKIHGELDGETLGMSKSQEILEAIVDCHKTLLMPLFKDILKPIQIENSKKIDSNENHSDVLYIWVKCLLTLEKSILTSGQFLLFLDNVNFS